MVEQEEARRKQGSVAVLAILFGLLLGIAGNAGTQLRFDPGSARLGNGEILRSAVSLRTQGRADEDGSDRDSAPALLAPPPLVVTEPLSAYPAAQPAQALAWAAPAGRHFRYHARAPPAA